MGEKRFVIKEIDGTELTDVIGSITEGELCRRWDLMLKKRLEESTSTRELIPILLHGEWEKGDELPRGLFHGPPEYRERAKITDAQPSPTPSRQEWEAWAAKLSHALITKIYFSREVQRAEVEKLLCERPRGKHGRETILPNRGR